MILFWFGFPEKQSPSSQERHVMKAGTRSWLVIFIHIQEAGREPRKQDKAKNLQHPATTSSRKALRPRGSITFPHSATNWGPSAQIHEFMRAISHASHKTIPYTTAHVCESLYHLDACESVLWCFGTMESPGIFLKCVLASNRPEVSSSRLTVFQHLASYLTSLELH